MLVSHVYQVYPGFQCAPRGRTRLGVPETLPGRMVYGSPAGRLVHHMEGIELVEVLAHPSLSATQATESMKLGHCSYILATSNSHGPFGLRDNKTRSRSASRLIVSGSGGYPPAMHIWKLSPLDTSARDWEASTCRDVVIVRAKNEEEARLCAMRRFAIATERDPKEDLRLCPWTQSRLVSCEELVDSRYQRTGEVAVLEPH